MKTKKIISLGGALALAVGLVMNVEYALGDYGLKSNSLNLFVMAQANGTSWEERNYGHQENTTAHCVKQITTTTTTTSGNSSSVSGDISGGIGGGFWNVGAGISGNTGNTSGSTTTTTVTTTETFDGVKLYCTPVNNYIEICYDYDPCK